MYHLAEMVRDARRDMAERHGDGAAGGAWSTLATFTPFPFLYALSFQISSTMVRRAPELAKRAAGTTRDVVADAVTHTHDHVVELRLATTRSGQRLFYRLKSRTERVWLPGPLAAARTHLLVPFLDGVEGVAQFVTSEELPELYFVAKNAMRRSFFLRHVVLPPLGAAEGVVRYVVILPSRVVFPSRAEVEDRADLFLEGSTVRVHTLVDHLYSATEVLDQHWSMVQWNILGRGPYESLSIERQGDVVRSVHQRMLILASHYKLFEFLATIKLQNERLYGDLLRTYPDVGGVPLTEAQVDANELLQVELSEQDRTAFPIWFYKKLDVASGNGQVLPSGLKPRGSDRAAETTTPASSSHRAGQWIEFPAHENRRLERAFRWYQTKKATQPGPMRPSAVVLVDEGRHEVDVERMEMTPVYWPALERIAVCRSRWVYAQRNYGLAPYNAEAAAALESAFVYYLALYPAEKQRLMDLEAQKPRGLFSSRASRSEAARSVRAEQQCTLSVPVDGHLVEFKGPQDIAQYKRLLAGTTPFTSKRRVYRGDPRVRGDAASLKLWTDAMDCDSATGRPLQTAAIEDDRDIDEDVDHLVLIVHGIGDALKTLDLINVVTLRSIIDCATTLRELNREALRSAHFADAEDRADGGVAGDRRRRRPRVEFLPIEWHSKLHMEGLDRLIGDVTLPAIPKLRELANDTVLDVLLFMSPLFHQVILDEVASEMNRVVELFRSRHPRWKDATGVTGSGRKKVSVIAHSLGSIICYDILNHQPTAAACEPPNDMTHTDDDEESSSDDSSDEPLEATGSLGLDGMLVDQKLQRRSRSLSEMASRRHSEGDNSLKKIEIERRSSPRSPPVGRRTRRKTTPRHKKNSKRKQPQHSGKRDSTTAAISPLVPKLTFEVEDLFCFGSPVGLFLNVRGQKLSRDFQLPHCRRLFNIYHPYDPVAYRIEPILNPARAHSKAAIIRTFEGKLRFQYQLRNSFRAMWASLRQWRRDFEHQVLAGAHSVGLVESAASLSPLSDALVAVTQPYQLQRRPEEEQQAHEEQRRGEREGDEGTKNVAVFGRLCQGLPIDYSLQENEIEIANEYLFALTAHVIYWGNRDASLFVAQKLILEPAFEDWPAGEPEAAVDLSNHQVVTGFEAVNGHAETEELHEKEEATASSEVSSGSEDELASMVASLRRRRRGVAMVP